MIDTAGLKMHLQQKYAKRDLKAARRQMAPPSTSIYDTPLYTMKSLGHLEKDLKVFDHWNPMKKKSSRESFRKHLTMMRSSIISFPEENIVLD
eukprot:CAMPEP_0184700276 /NCGR_PEP_ID=MMETSP0313-20130426/11331_1 /TAXON_ID=2792 /ORGANISM="Porphyridium aerugineum, Strain SAG 1380-2" /LENGTH=92 /DNA_ID=CAMNT_0027159857 /DNA_START=721 /DNA_END=999 /DNA_ORIENTATION=+